MVTFYGGYSPLSSKDIWGKGKEDGIKSVAGESERKRKIEKNRQEKKGQEKKTWLMTHASIKSIHSSLLRHRTFFP